MSRQLPINKNTQPQESDGASIPVVVWTLPPHVTTNTYPIRPKTMRLNNLAHNQDCIVIRIQMIAREMRNWENG